MVQLEEKLPGEEGLNLSLPVWEGSTSPLEEIQTTPEEWGREGNRRPGSTLPDEVWSYPLP